MTRLLDAGRPAPLPSTVEDTTISRQARGHSTPSEASSIEHSAYATNKSLVRQASLEDTSATQQYCTALEAQASVASKL